MSTSELLDRQAVSGAHVNKCSRRKQTAKDGVRAWHADLRWHATPVAGPRIGGPARAHVNAGPCADRPKCLDRAGPRVKRPRVRACVLRERETPHTPLSHTSVSAYTTRAAYQNSADEALVIRCFPLGLHGSRCRGLGLAHAGAPSPDRQPA